MADFVGRIMSCGKLVLSIVLLMNLSKVGALWKWTNFANQTHVHCGKTHWVHIPKTSSTFCLNMQHVCCTTKYEYLVQNITTANLTSVFRNKNPHKKKPYDFKEGYCYTFHREGYPTLECPYAGRPEHVPLTFHPRKRHAHALTVIREPKSRVVSAFLDAIHLEGMPVPEAKAFRDKILSVMKPRTQESFLEGLKLYIANPKTMGCQTKMLIGAECAGYYNLTQESVDKAVDRLSNFFFVGLFDQYNRSLHLFHALANKSTMPSPVELFPQRIGDSILKNYLKSNIPDYNDPYDSQLYEKARTIFNDQITYVTKMYPNILI